MTQHRSPRWFQLHLPTGIVLMCLVSVLLWLNFVWRCDRSYIQKYEVANSQYVRIWATFKNYGWPYKQELTPPLVVFETSPSLETSGSTINLPIELPNLTDDYKRVFADGGIALGIFAAVALLLELIIRRFAYRQHTLVANAASPGC